MTNKKVLVMYAGNSGRSIIGEALIHTKLDVLSCGVLPCGKVNPNAKKVLNQNNIWSDKYCSKYLYEVAYVEFDAFIDTYKEIKRKLLTTINKALTN